MGLESEILLLVKEIKNKYDKINKLEICLIKEEGNIFKIETKFYDENRQFFNKIISINYKNNLEKEFKEKFEKYLKKENIIYEIIEEKGKLIYNF